MDCATTHSTCYQESCSGLPTRVVDVSQRNQNPHLVLSTGDEEVAYVALSHCWGPLVPGSRLLRTTSVNIESMRREIPLESMPQNFQDAVTVTRMLGLHYLWIDSLCIIQDSKEDWEKEGAKMGDIYKNAFVTIAATSASRSEDGFLKYSTNDSRTAILLPALSASEESGELILQETTHTASHWEEAVESSTWNDRAWTMQERFLARCVIHFSKHQIYWECHAHNEDPAEEIGGPSFMHELYTWWYIIAAQYSSRKLTYASDKLPALSGIAAEMLSLASPHVSDRYLCGIWEEDLAHGLLWRYSETRNHMCHPSRTPSWSWA
ncbi:HET-domain-containing protein, partial [Lindgomyces ingoldianus]